MWQKETLCTLDIVYKKLFCLNNVQHKTEKETEKSLNFKFNEF